MSQSRLGGPEYKTPAGYRMKLIRDHERVTPAGENCKKPEALCLLSSRQPPVNFEPDEPGNDLSIER